MHADGPRLPTAANKRLAPPRPAAAPEKPGATVSEQFEVRVVSKDGELVGPGSAGFANLGTLCASVRLKRHGAAICETLQPVREIHRVPVWMSRTVSSRCHSSPS